MHTFVAGRLDMPQYKVFLSTEIFGSEVSIVSTPRYGILTTYAFISFFATARNDTTP